MKRLPSTSKRYGPSPRSIKSGCPPTARNAPTGESTPPGSRVCASWKREMDFAMFMKTSRKGLETRDWFERVFSLLSCSLLICLQPVHPIEYSQECQCRGSHYLPMRGWD